MGARSGEDYKRKLREQPPEIWHRGKPIRDVTSEPGFAGGVSSYAALFDRRLEEPSVNFFASPTSGEKVHLSFLEPASKTEVETVGNALQFSADFSCGMFGRDPSYLNRAVVSYASAASWMAEADQRFGQNIRAYADYMRENDLALTHTLINPQANRSKPVSEQHDKLGAHVTKETDAGIHITGARMLATMPISDEIMVFPSTLLQEGEASAPYAFAFCIPNATPGLKFLCRDSFDLGRSHYDAPLASRFEEMDAVVLFDDVFVPWERVFLFKDVARCNQSMIKTTAVVNMAHQVVCKNIAKTEFVLGLASLMVDAIGAHPFQHIHEKIAELWVTLETMKAFRRAAELDAAPNVFGMMIPAWDPLDAARNLFPRLYPRMVEIIQQIGASGLASMPSEADVNGPLAAEIKRYFDTGRMDAMDRIPLFRLATDLAVSAFGARQVLYERFFFGDPVRMAGAVFNDKDRSRAEERVRELLRRPN
jgi:4-hydroxyphenylacetate 3-monooxygenase